jgi:hypothetical protein
VGRVGRGRRLDAAEAEAEPTTIILHSDSQLFQVPVSGVCGQQTNRIYGKLIYGFALTFITFIFSVPVSDFRFSPRGCI